MTRIRAGIRAVLLALSLSLAASGAAVAVQPDEVLQDAAMEARARSISGGLRCLVCQNQSIDDSDAPLARDLRLLVRERLQAGDSDTQVRDYLVARFGEFVLLKPPFALSTMILWAAPFLMLLGALAFAYRMMSGAGPATGQASTELTAEERAAFDKLVAEKSRD